MKKKDRFITLTQIHKGKEVGDVLVNIRLISKAQSGENCTWLEYGNGRLFVKETPREINELINIAIK